MEVSVFGMKMAAGRIHYCCWSMMMLRH